MRIYKIMLLLHLAITSYKVSAQNSLHGKVTDIHANTPLEGVTIYLPDLKTGAVSDSTGHYVITNLPKGNFIVEVRYVGYETISSSVSIIDKTEKNFTIHQAVVEHGQVVITGTSRATEIRKSPIPVATTDKKHIDQNVSTNIIDAITHLPGVTAVSSGPNVSKPFIRGLGFNRILTLYDGIRQEGQQWGDEHGIEIDENTVNRIEVVKGPASVIYGSDALAGVVNLLPYPPAYTGHINGDVTANYQSNNGQYALSGALDGNTKGFIWGGRGSYKTATNYQNKIDGRVYGTGYCEKDANAYIGLNKQWGYSHLNFMYFDDEQQIPEGSRDSVTRKFTKHITEADTIRSIVSDDELKSYDIPVVHQRVQHYRVYSSNNYMLGSGNIALKLGYQQSIRREYSHPEYADLPGLYLDLKTATYDLKYNLPEFKKWSVTTGINGMWQRNRNKGNEFIIPDYKQFDAGPFLFARKEFGKLNFNAGVRYDMRSFSNDDMYVIPNPETGFDMIVSDSTGAAHPFTKYKHTFTGVTGSIGIAHNFSDAFTLKANVARGFRAPNISEISANGVHPGTNIYQIGNPAFKPELSLQQDLGLFFSFYHVEGSIELFNNNISNYIFNQKVLNAQGGDSVIVEGSQTFQYRAARAQLFGGEANIDIHPHPWDWLHFENSVSVVYSINHGIKGETLPADEKYLPFTPPVKITSELRAALPKKYKYMRNVYFKLNMEHYLKQDRIFAAYNTETATPSYTLFNAGLGADFTNAKGNTLFTVNIAGSNIFDTAYQSHLSLLKYAEDYSASPNGRLGIYNMGRNISVKVSVPLSIK